MRFRIGCSVLLILTFAAPNASAQVDVGLTGSALLTIQPINDWYGGSPYLNEGIGGLAPGLAAGVSVITRSGLAMIGEFSTARSFEQSQKGRLVDTLRNSSGSGTSDTRMRDSLWSALIGFAIGGTARRLIIAGGVTWVTTTMTENGTPIKDFDFGGRAEHSALAMSAGADFHNQLAERVSLVIGGRFSGVDRSSIARNLGAGGHIVRITGGIRLRFSK